LPIKIIASWRHGIRITGLKSVKTADSDELEKHADYSCEIPKHAVVVADGLLHDLGEVREVPPISPKRPEQGASCTD
jgi:hypothetical protein